MPTNEWNLRDETRSWVARIGQAMASPEQAGLSARPGGTGPRTRGAVRARGAAQTGATQAACAHEGLSSLIAELETRAIPCRLEVAAALGLGGDASMVGALDALKTDPSPSVRFVVADALGRIGGHQATETLLSMAESDYSDVVRVQALGTLSLLTLNQRRLAREQAGREQRTSGPARVTGVATEASEIPRVLQRLASGDRSDRVRQAAQALLDALRVPGDAASPAASLQH